MKPMTLEEIQQVSLDILKDVHRFCMENDISYTLFGGTMIGAFRHKGFVPWDDDLDIAMPRPDYDRFISTYQSACGYELNCYEKGGCELAFARVSEMKETLAYSTLPWLDHDTGVSIDIFPLDGVPDDPGEAKRFFKKLYWRWNFVKLHRVARRQLSTAKNGATRRNIMIRKILFGNPISNRINWVKRHVNACKEIPFGSTNHFANISFMEYGMREYQLMEDYQSTILVPFEDGMFCVCNGYDRLMRTKYGDYMQMPPKEKQGRKHGGAKTFWKNK